MTEERSSCIDPGGIADDDLLAFARGESSAAAAHIMACPACRAEVSAYGRLEPLLHTRLFRRSCPETLVLGEYALDALAPTVRMGVAAHLVDCSHCRDELREFSTFLAEPDAPAPRTGLVGALRRIFATPLPALNARAAGLRGGDRPEEDITYEAEGLRVLVSVQRGARPSERTIAGMVQSDQLVEGARVRLFSADRVVATEAVDDLNAFLFANVSPGTYRLELQIPDAVIVVDAVDAN